MIYKNIPSTEKNNETGTYKLCNLLSFLRHTTAEFEIIANRIEDKDLQMALLSIATETKQYANELNSQLKCLNVYYLSPLTHFKNEDVSEFVYQGETSKNEKNVSSICDQSEVFFTSAYGDILNEYFPYPFLRGVISSQFKGIKSAFMNMRLLNLVKLN